MEIIRKNYQINEIKALDEEGFFEGLASVEIIDRDNEIVDIDSLVLDEFKMNPIMCFQHDGWDHRTLPIGKFPEIFKTKSADGLKSLGYKGFISETREDIRTQVIKERILRTTSICFYIGSRVKDPSGAVRLLDCILLEISIAKIPSNIRSLTKSMEEYYSDLHAQFEKKIEGKDSLNFEFAKLDRIKESSLIRVKFPDQKGISATIGTRNDLPDIMIVQSVSFDPEKWDREKAQKWIESDMKNIKIKQGRRDETEEEILSAFLRSALYLST